MPTIHKLFEYNAALNCLKFSDKMGLSIWLKTLTQNIVTQFALNFETYFSPPYQLRA